MKLCIFCSQCDFEEAWGGTDATPGYVAGLSCYEHPQQKAPLGSQSQFIRWVKEAETCRHYEVSK